MSTRSKRPLKQLDAKQVSTNQSIKPNVKLKSVKVNEVDKDVETDSVPPLARRTTKPKTRSTRVIKSTNITDESGTAPSTRRTGKSSASSSRVESSSKSDHKPEISTTATKRMGNSSARAKSPTLGETASVPFKSSTLSKTASLKSKSETAIKSGLKAKETEIKSESTAGESEIQSESTSKEPETFDKTESSQVSCTGSTKSVSKPASNSRSNNIPKHSESKPIPESIPESISIPKQEKSLLNKLIQSLSSYDLTTSLLLKNQKSIKLSTLSPIIPKLCPNDTTNYSRLTQVILLLLLKHQKQDEWSKTMQEFESKTFGFIQGCIRVCLDGREIKRMVSATSKSEIGVLVKVFGLDYEWIDDKIRVLSSVEQSVEVLFLKYTLHLQAYPLQRDWEYDEIDESMTSLFYNHAGRLVQEKQYVDAVFFLGLAVKCGGDLHKRYELMGDCFNAQKLYAEAVTRYMQSLECKIEMRVYRKCVHVMLKSDYTPVFTVLRSCTQLHEYSLLKGMQASSACLKKCLDAWKSVDSVIERARLEHQDGNVATALGLLQTVDLDECTNNQRSLVQVYSSMFEHETGLVVDWGSLVDSLVKCDESVKRVLWEYLLRIRCDLDICLRLRVDDARNAFLWIRAGVLGEARRVLKEHKGGLWVYYSSFINRSLEFEDDTESLFFKAITSKPLVALPLLQECFKVFYKENNWLLLETILRLAQCFISLERIYDAQRYIKLATRFIQETHARHECVGVIEGCILETSVDIRRVDCVEGSAYVIASTLRDVRAGCFERARERVQEWEGWIDAFKSRIGEITTSDAVLLESLRVQAKCCGIIAGIDFDIESIKSNDALYCWVMGQVKLRELYVILEKSVVLGLFPCMPLVLPGGSAVQGVEGLKRGVQGIVTVLEKAINEYPDAWRDIAQVTFLNSYLFGAKNSLPCRERGFDQEFSEFQSFDVKSLPRDLIVVEMNADLQRNVLYVTRHTLNGSNSLSLPVARHDTATQSICSLVDEFNAILAQSDDTLVNSIKYNDRKSEWWRSRRQLDATLRGICASMNDWIGGFDGVFALNDESTTLLNVRVDLSDFVMHLLLHSSDPTDVLGHVLYCNRLAGFPDFDVVKLADQIKPIKSECGHIVLLLDDVLSRLPWESVPCLSGKSVSRVLSMSHLHACLDQRLAGPRVSYLLNPVGDLSHTQTLFQDLLPGNGITARIPSKDEYALLVHDSDVFLYFGHGGGQQFAQHRYLAKKGVAPVGFLFGCSSVQCVDEWVLGGAKSVVCVLWDVTDRDLDRFARVLLDKVGLFGGLSNEDLGVAVATSRDACNLEFLVGGAPVLYGMPVRFKIS